MKVEEAQYLNKISSRALALNDLYRKAVGLSKWVTSKSKKGITGWRVLIEPQGIGYNYRNSISINIPLDIGAKEIKALAEVIKKQAREQLIEIKIDLKSIDRN